MRCSECGSLVHISGDGLKFTCHTCDTALETDLTELALILTMAVSAGKANTIDKEKRAMFVLLMPLIMTYDRCSEPEFRQYVNSFIFKQDFPCNLTAGEIYTAFHKFMSKQDAPEREDSENTNPHL